jgi:hypothetical protein
MGDFKIRENHVYVGNTDKVIEWSGFLPEDEASEASELNKAKLVTQVRERIKNYLQLDHVNFLFGTGSSIHLGAAGIQNIPLQIEKDIDASGDEDLKEDFKKYIQALQKPLVEKYNPEADTEFEDERGWKLISDGIFIRNYKDEENENGKHYDEILLQFELLLNYLTAMLFQRESEKNDVESKRLQKLISVLKKTLFGICDVHERKTSTKDLERIKEKGFEEEF